MLNSIQHLLSRGQTLKQVQGDGVLPMTDQLPLDL